MQNILNEIHHALTIEDPIEQRNTHKEILVKIKHDPLLFTNKTFQSFLLESLQMFSNDNYYELCVNLFKQTYSFVDLNLYTVVIEELCKTEKHASFGSELKNRLQKRKTTDTVIKKKVSFNKCVETKYYQPVNFSNTLDTSRILENKRQMKNNSFDEIDWYTPEKIDNISIINLISEESLIQNRREGENVNFTNTEIGSKCVPSDCTNKDEQINSKAIELPIVDLRIKNVYKKLDFVKILENKDFDLNALLNDPDLLDTLK